MNESARLFLGVARDVRSYFRTFITTSLDTRTCLWVATGGAAHTSSSLSTGLAGTSAVTILSRICVKVRVRIRTGIRKLALSGADHVTAAATKRGIFKVALSEGSGG